MENDIRALVLTLLLSVAAAPRAGAQADFRLEPVMDTPTAELARKFRTPPGEAGMSCYWWWLNGHTTEEAITRDLEEMKAKGYGSTPEDSTPSPPDRVPGRYSCRKGGRDCTAMPSARPTGWASR